SLTPTPSATPTVTSTPVSYSPAVLADLPIGYWRLGESSGQTTASDASGNSHAGTYVNGPTLGVPGALAGDGDTAARFSAASSQYVTIANSSAFDVSALSVELWVKTSATTTMDLVKRQAGTYQ